MVEFKVVCSDPESKKSYPVTVSGHHANSLVGKKIGDDIDGMFVNLPGYKLKITGGSDKDGFPMRPEVPAIGRKKILVSEGIGFHPKWPGQRRRRTFRGNTISPEIVQINLKVVQKGGKPIDQLLGVKQDEGSKTA